MGTSMIEGVTLFPLREIGDERGAVLHMFRSDSPEFTTFGECYFSEVLPGAIKAWKRHSLQTQNLAVPVGRIRIVMFDNRTSSTSQNRLEIIELGRPDAYLRIRIPPGIWYGFTCISSEKALLANCADIPHQLSESETMSINQSIIPYHWV
jgi:dTDP-4-dehydrorhamnose 3,5-epimerase